MKNVVFVLYYNSIEILITVNYISTNQKIRFKKILYVR